jgi:hypothetical protein
MSATETGGRQGEHRISKPLRQHRLRWKFVGTGDGAIDDERQNANVRNREETAKKSRTYSPLHVPGPPTAVHPRRKSSSTLECQQNDSRKE